MALRKHTRFGLIAVLLLGCVGCDQISKHLVRSSVELGQTHSYLGDTVRLTNVQNPGAFLSAGATLSQPVRTILFQGIVGLIVLGLVLAALMARNLGTWGIAAITLLAASGLGNLLDRMLQDGRVTDFLNLGIGPLRTGIFNVADVVGVLGVAVLFFFKEGRKGVTS